MGKRPSWEVVLRDTKGFVSGTLRYRGDFEKGVVVLTLRKGVVMLPLRKGVVARGPL